MIICINYGIFIAVFRHPREYNLNSTALPPYGKFQAEVTAAEFAELAAGPDFPMVVWVTLVYHTDLHKLSAYGYWQGIDHHLVVTGLDSQDEKRSAEVMAAFGVVSEAEVREALHKPRFCHSFVSSSLGV